MNARQYVDKCSGYLLGCAIGDALGRTRETTPHSLNQMQILRELPLAELPPIEETIVGGPLTLLPPGSYTDDASISLSHAQYFVDHPRPSPQRLFLSVRRSLGKWFIELPKHTGDGFLSALDMSERERYLTRFAGSTTLSAAGEYARHPTEVRALNCASCGPLTRVGAVLIADSFTCDPYTLGMEYAAQTHAHMATKIGCAITARLITFCMEQSTFKWRSLIDESLAACRELAQRATVSLTSQSEITNILARLETLGNTLIAGDFALALATGTGSHPFDVLVRGIAILSITNGDFADTARIVSRLGGDSDSVGAFACSLSGMLRGANAVPRELISFVTGKGQLNGVRVQQIARRLASVHSRGRIYFRTQASPPPMDCDWTNVRDVELGRQGGFATHARLLSCSSGSYLDVLRCAANDEQCIVCERGVLRIGTNSMLGRVSEIVEYVERTRKCERDVTHRKRTYIVTTAKRLLRKTRANNDRWHLMRLIQSIGTDRAIKALEDQPGGLGIRLARAVRRERMDSQIGAWMDRLRRSAGAIERHFVEIDVILGDSTSLNGLQSAVGFEKAATWRLGSIESMERMARLGGLFSIEQNGKAAGPWNLQTPPRVRTAKLGRRFPVPLSRSALMECCANHGLRCVSVFQRRDTVVVGDPITGVSVITGQGENWDWDGEAHRRRARESERIWNCLLEFVGGKIAENVLGWACSVVFDVLLRDEYGCAIVIVNDARCCGELLHAGILRRPIPLHRFNRSDNRGVLRRTFGLDGCMVVSSETSDVVEVGCYLAAAGTPAINVASHIAHWLDKTQRGSRHRAAAQFAAACDGAAVVVVGSQRGDVTVFGNGWLVVLHDAMGRDPFLVGDEAELTLSVNGSGNRSLIMTRGLRSDRLMEESSVRSRKR